MHNKYFSLSYWFFIKLLFRRFARTLSAAVGSIVTKLPAFEALDILGVWLILGMALGTLTTYMLA